jgi:hypothetical protein
MSVRDWTQLIGFVVVAVAVGIVVIGLLRLSRRAHQRKPKRPAGGGSNVGVWLTLIVVTAAITYARTPTRPGPAGQPAQPRVSDRVIVLSVVGLGVALLAGGIGIAYYQHHDPDVSKVVKRANAGDVDGAIAELRAAMRRGLSDDDTSTSGNPYAAPSRPRRGAAVRANTLGLLHFLREEWPQAYESFVDAEKLGAGRAVARGNQALALWKMGRLDEAEPILAEVCSLVPGVPTFALNHGFVLADLGRLDEARARLVEAERGVRLWVLVKRADREKIRAEVARLRAKIDAG